MSLQRWAELGAIAATGAQDLEQVQHLARRLVICMGTEPLDLDISPNLIHRGAEVVYEAPVTARNYLPYVLFRHGIRRLSFSGELSQEQAVSLVLGFTDCVGPDGAELDLTDQWVRRGVTAVRWITPGSLGERVILGSPEGLKALGTLLDQVAPQLMQPGRLEPTGSGMLLQEDPFETEALLVSAREAVVQAFAQSEAGGVRAAVGHLAHLLACFALRAPSPLGAQGLAALVSRMMVEAAESRDWPLYSALARSFRLLAQLREEVGEMVALSLDAIERALVSPEVLRALAVHLDDDRSFNLWARWFFAVNESLELDGVLAAIEHVHEGPGHLFLRDLLNQQGLGSLERWAARLREGSLDDAFKLLQLLEEGALGEGGAVLLRMALRHPHREIRVRAITGLGRRRPPRLVEALAPLLVDPEASVRRTATRILVEGGGPPAARALAQRVAEPEFRERPAGERRAIMEALGVLGGAAAQLALIKAVQPVDAPWRAGDHRWPAVYGLIRLGAPASSTLTAIERALEGAGLVAELEGAREACNGRPWAQPTEAPKVDIEPISRDTMAFIDGGEMMGDALLFEPKHLLEQVIVPVKTLAGDPEDIAELEIPALDSLDEMFFDAEVWDTDHITKVEFDDEEEGGAEGDAEIEAEAPPPQAVEVQDLLADYLGEPAGRPAREPGQGEGRQSRPEAKAYLKKVVKRYNQEEVVEEKDLSSLLQSFLKEGD